MTEVSGTREHYPASDRSAYPEAASGDRRLLAACSPRVLRQRESRVDERDGQEDEHQQGEGNLFQPLLEEPWVFPDPLRNRVGLEPYGVIRRQESGDDERPGSGRRRTTAPGRRPPESGPTDRNASDPLRTTLALKAKPQSGLLTSDGSAGEATRSGSQHVEFRHGRGRQDAGRAPAAASNNNPCNARNLMTTGVHCCRVCALLSSSSCRR